MEPHASTWLHGCSLWLFMFFLMLWDVIALNNLNIKVYVRSLRNWFTTNWSPNECSTIDIVGWARKVCFVSLAKLWNSKIEARKDFMCSKREGSWETTSFLFSAGNYSSILKSTFPVNGSPISLLALCSISMVSDINSNS